MKTFKYKIQLEQFRSRLPLMIDSFDNEGNLLEFNHSGITECYPIGNYGMIPCDVVFTTTDVPSFDHSLFKQIDDGKYAIHYPLLNTMYHFFQDYKSLLYNKKCYYETSISSATQYWEVYGGDEIYYKGLDKTYADYGGSAMTTNVIDKIFVPLSSHTIDVITSNASSTCFRIPLLITNTIEDLGEYSIFSEDWVEKAEYSTGSTVIYNGEAYLKTNDEESYYIDKNKITHFNDSGWTKYIDEHVDDVSSESNWYYVYDQNGQIHLFQTNSSFLIEVKSASYHALPYPMTISNNGFLGYGNTPIECERLEYVVSPYDSNKYIFVKYDSKGKYIEVGGKKYYFDRSGNATINKVICGDSGTTVQMQSSAFANVGLNLYKVDSTAKTCKVGKNTYSVLNSYIKVGNETVYISGNSLSRSLVVSSIDGTLREYNGLGPKWGRVLPPSADSTTYIIDYDNQVVKAFSPCKYYSAHYITGETVSKLSDFKNPVTLIDGCGNNILGHFDIVDSNYAHPLEDSTIDLLYNVGDVANLTEVKLTDSDDSATEENDTTEVTPDLYWGNILYDMVFFYSTPQGDVTSGYFSAKTYNGNNLSAITEAAKDWCSNHHDGNYAYTEPLDDLKCTFTYYNGAILEKVDGKFDLYGTNEALHGVKYTETYTLQKTSVEYFVSKKISYSIYWYNMIGEEKPSVYNGTEVMLPKTTFQVYLNTDFSTDDEISFSKKNAMTYAPIFRKEENIGASSKPKVESDIFIDRPIIKPLERHLMLLDINSLDAMEDYGNGIFNIISNN